MNGKRAALLSIASLSCLLALAALAAAQKTGNSANNQPPEVTIPHSEYLTIVSKYVDDTFYIEVTLPFTYQDSTAMRYPVLYGGDADDAFNLSEMTRLLGVGDPRYPEVISVGIAYGVDWQSKENMRERDFTMAKQEGKPSGGASAYAAFIRNELIPLIESRYRVKTGDRTLGGGSLGATFCAYCLFTQPDLFNRYVLLSPGLREDVYRLEETYAAAHADLPAIVYISAGTLDSYCLPHAKRFYDLLQKRQYPDLRCTLDIFEDESHVSGAFMGYLKGLRWVYEQK
jgi:predicted alpha/beta superfamily hydrolase